MENVVAIAQIQSFTALGVGLIFGLGALGLLPREASLFGLGAFTRLSLAVDPLLRRRPEGQSERGNGEDGGMSHRQGLPTISRQSARSAC